MNKRGSAVEYIFVTIAALLMLLGFLMVFGSLIHLFFFQPYIAEDALQQCREEGFDFYEKYQAQPFSKKALGVTCGYAQKFEVKLQDSIPVRIRGDGGE